MHLQGKSLPAPPSSQQAACAVHGSSLLHGPLRKANNNGRRAVCLQRRQQIATHQNEDSAAMYAQQGGGEAATGTASCFHALNEPVIWQGTEEEALRSPTSYFRGLSPTWKVLLLSDGSVTRHLQLLTSAATKADCFEMLDIGNNTDGLPKEVQSIPGPRVQRQVLLRPSFSREDPGEPEKSQGSSSSSSRSSSSNSSSTRGLEDQQPLVYACSWWNAAQAGQYLQDRSLPIWNSLSQGHVELYREDFLGASSSLHANSSSTQMRKK